MHLALLRSSGVVTWETGSAWQGRPVTLARHRPISRRGALGVLGGLGLLGSLGAGALGLLTTLRGGSPSAKVLPGTIRDVETCDGLTGEWWVPPTLTGLLPTVVLVHGGYWRAGYDRSLENPVAADLCGRGFLVWNIDYRSSATPWPATLTDVAAGYDHLLHGRHAGRVDPARVAVVGHSAGGQLALWLGSRTRLPAGAPGVVAAAAGPGAVAATPGTVAAASAPGVVVGGPPVALVVAQAPVASFVRAAREKLGSGAVDALLGGSPAEQGERLAIADPMALLPSGTRTVLIHGSDDDTVPISQSQDYVAAATAKNGVAHLVTVPGGHFEHLDPTSRACAALRDALSTL